MRDTQGEKNAEFLKPLKAANVAKKVYEKFVGFFNFLEKRWGWREQKRHKIKLLPKNLIKKTKEKKPVSLLGKPLLFFCGLL